jgi:DNA polymerase-3 subunit alpha (Gram-positive type)
MAKAFLQVFSRYNPSEEKRKALSSVTDAKYRYTQDEPRRFECELYFSRHIDAEILYEIEDECQELYSAASFKILPHFPKESFSLERLREIFAEASLYGAVTSGFFSRAKFKDDGENITVFIPFSDGGINFIKNAKTNEILENILFSRYCVRRKFIIAESSDADAYARELAEKRREILERAKTEAREQRERLNNVQSVSDPTADFERRAGISDALGKDSLIGSTRARMGTTTYDFSDSRLAWGEDFDVCEPTPLSQIENFQGTGVFLGTVFENTSKETRQGDKRNFTIGISDGVSAIYIKRAIPINEAGACEKLSVGTHIAVLGKTALDRFDNDTVLVPRGIKTVSVYLREDTAQRKRVELHMHTNMSQMDALSSPKDIIKTAIRFGHPAVAITDHGNVQSFPEAMLALEKVGEDKLKVLYGMEGYFVNDTAKCIFGKVYPAFDGEMVVFDIETTGLSYQSCKIIEIGAVKISAGEIVDRFDTFVDPECAIPEKITSLTGISDEMVLGAPKEREALLSFFDFIGDRMLIAHNASFDISFIREAAKRQNLPFENSYLDTLGLSRYLNANLKNHKLDTLVKHYKIGEFNHHRASDDSEVLAKIVFKMIVQLREEGVRDFDSAIEAMGEKTDPLKLRPYHIIIFAKNKVGLKNLYKLVSISNLEYYKRNPRIPKTVLEAHREGLIIGSACEAGELYRAILDNRTDAEIEEIADFYDYLEIQPLSNNRFLIDEGRVKDEEALKDINRRIYALGKKLGKPVCATCDAHFIEKDDEIYRRILLAGLKFSDADKPMPIYYRTTDEMLSEFEYLGREIAEEVVIDNPNKIADMIERLRPIPKGKYDPEVPGAEEELTASCYKRAREWYGDPIPPIVEKRLEKELSSIIKNGFAGLYMIAVKLVAHSESLGYLVGSRGSVGSSLVATLSGISEVNPLVPHYRCEACRYTEFITDGSVGSGFDLPDKICPVCGKMLYQDGHDIPFETFLGFNGDKSPDIDLNFSGDVQGKVHKYTEELFGEGQVFRAGTTGTLASKTAWGFINKYLEERKIKIPKAAISYMATRMVGVKRTTGQHPGGIIVIPKGYDVYDFTPIQHPADDPHSDIITTHFQFTYLHDTILKLDELGHDIPTKYKMLERYTDTSVLDVKMNDKSVYELFESTKPLGVTPEQLGGCQLGTYGIPEMGTRFIQQVLIDAKPKTFSDLLQISGLTHGTDVWLGNAQDLIKAGTCTISEVVGTRDGIMTYLMQKGMPDAMAFDIMEKVRKGKGVSAEYEKEMLAHDVPQWYVDSCRKIKYMFPKAHAAAYDMSAIRLGWYKIYYPMQFYAAFLTVAPGGFDAEIVGRGYRGVSDAIREIEEKGNEATQKENETCQTLYLVREALARGVKFLGVDLKKSDAKAFLPENGAIRMPFNSLQGLGDTAAEKIIEVRNKYEIYSVEDLRQRTGVSKTVIEVLRRNGVLDGLSEENQYTLF